MARARTANGRYLKGIRAPEAKVLDQYVSIVSRLPFVEEVRAEPGYEGVQIWTVIDSEPFDISPRRRVYEAELRAAQIDADACVSFRLVNRREYGDENLSQVLPDDSHVAWRRAAQS